MKPIMTVSVLALLASSGHAFAQCSSAAAECATKTAKASCEVSGQAMVVAEEAEAADKDIIDTAVAAGSFKTLAAALKAAGLVEALKGKGPFTVFAPTDEAFAKLPKGTVETLLKPENKAALTRILTYHVVAANVPSKDVKTGAAETLSGQRIDLKVQTKDGKTTVKVDNATVTAADVTASNGVIHVIDTVILPSDKTIVQTAAADSNFKTLASLITTAGLADALSGEGPFTVFAPTDAAFAKLPKETVESLLKPENKSKLQDILKFHVVPSRVFSDAALKAGKAKTLQGQEITIKIENGKPMVNGAVITATDIDASNGVIHVIDTVILPK